MSRYWFVIQFPCHPALVSEPADFRFSVKQPHVSVGDLLVTEITGFRVVAKSELLRLLILQNKVHGDFILEFR